MLNTCAELGVLVLTLPNAAVPETEIAGAEPVPVRAVSLFVPSQTTRRLLVRAPAAPGVKTTLRETELPAAMVKGVAGAVMAKSAVEPVFIAMDVTVMMPLPVLLMLNTCAELGVLVLTLPNAAVPETEIAGAEPVPVRAVSIVCAIPDNTKITGAGAGSPRSEDDAEGDGASCREGKGSGGSSDGEVGGRTGIHSNGCHGHDAVAGISDVEYMRSTGSAGVDVAERSGTGDGNRRSRTGTCKSGIRIGGAIPDNTKITGACAGSPWSEDDAEGDGTTGSNGKGSGGSSDGEVGGITGIHRDGGHGHDAVASIVDVEYMC